MKTKTKKLKLGIFLFLLFALPLGTLAQTTTVSAYVCGTGQAVLIPDFGTYTPATGDRIVWSEVGGSAVTYTVGTDPINFTTPTGLQDGEHKYTVHVIPVDPTVCPGDNSNEYIIYKLPTTTITLAAPVSTYCTDASSRSIITATPAIAPPTGVTFDYTWSATFEGNPVTDLSTLGSSSSNVFNLASGVAPGAYIFTATAKYNTGSTPIRPAASCEITSSTQAITVTAKPDKPTVTIQ